MVHATLHQSRPQPESPQPESPLPAVLRRALDRTLGGRPRVVLAVSGGLDSMVLLHAVAAWRPAAMQVTVATFDHGTGPAASRAARLVTVEGRRLGLHVVRGRARRPGSTEAEWRVQRWRFLRRVARRVGAPVVTAHTRDDAVETAFMRLLRGAGARGLAALHAPSPVLRPWLRVPRATLAAIAAARDIPHVKDPSNRDLRHLRTRVRLELLPAMRRVQPRVDEELLRTARRAARWRRAVERVVDALGARPAAEGGIHVARGALDGYSPEELAILWPAIAARAGVRLDRRGTLRAAAFTTTVRARVARVPLAGGAELLALPDRWVIRHGAPGVDVDLPLVGEVRVGGWRLRPSGVGRPEGLWQAALPGDVALSVRSWRAGDRIRAEGRPAARRVKRFLAEAGVSGPLRAGWPVVLLDDEIVWIPGVCRSSAATARPGWPVVHYQCDRIGS